MDKKMNDQAFIVSQPVSEWKPMISFLISKLGKPNAMNPALFWVHTDYSMRWDFSRGAWVVSISNPKIATEFLLRW